MRFLRMKKNMPSPINARANSPPTTPPAMAPALGLLPGLPLAMPPDLLPVLEMGVGLPVCPCWGDESVKLAVGAVGDVGVCETDSVNDGIGSPGLEVGGGRSRPATNAGMENSSKLHNSGAAEVDFNHISTSFPSFFSLAILSLRPQESLQGRSGGVVEA